MKSVRLSAVELYAAYGSNMDPEQIHEIGLGEVQRIEAEQMEIAKTLGFQDLKTFRASLKDNARSYAKSPEDNLQR